MAISSSEHRAHRRPPVEASSEQRERNLEAARVLAAWSAEDDRLESVDWLEFERQLDAARRG